MNRGAYWAGTPLQTDTDEGEMAAESAEPANHSDTSEFDSLNGADVADDAPVRPAASFGERIMLGAFGLFAFAWIAAMVAMAFIAHEAGTLGLPDVIHGISLASGPLALLVALLILWQRNHGREAKRYSDVARTVRMETLALDAVLSLTSRRLAEDRSAVAEQADQLLALADETSSRLRNVTEALAGEIAELGRQSRGLDEAAGTARVDMGVLLADLPTAEMQTRALANMLRTAGAGAHEQAAALDAMLVALVTRAREAEEGAGGAANRLSAQVSRIAGASEVAMRDIDEAGLRMNGAIDGVLARTANAIEHTRQSVATQSEAIDAMIEQAQATAETASAEAALALENRVSAIGQGVQAIANQLAGQDDAGARLLERIQRGLSSIEARFAELDETGRTRTERLGEALGALGGHAERTMVALNEGGTAATTLINRAETLKAAIRACLIELGEDLPAALARLETEAARSRETIGASGPEVSELNTKAREAADALDAARIALDGRRAALEAMSETITARVAAAKSDAESLGETVADVDAKANQLADSTSPKLVDALIRVRETAGQAAERAREALSSIIPNSAAALGSAGREALERAIGSEVEGQLARVSAASARAVEAANAAALKLEQQLSRVAETSASVEGHIAQGKAEVEATDRDNFSRRVSLLIDSLNSTSIDVNKLLSAEPSDSAWAAYLRGDRGIFTRRAVRLLDNGEAREITRHYEADADFRDQVNRYIHDFEALLRPILATRDGSTLAVILLSSEMGKLYVALAQAIERLRA